LIIDDILDEGITLSEIISKCKKMGAKNIFYTALFNKLIDKEKSLFPSYHVLNVPNKFVFGFGLDYQGFGRSLPDLHIIN
jgi:hypoxanthine phosphoribosyltransferase